MSDLNIPAGFVRNAVGHLVPVDQVREHDKLREALPAILVMRPSNSVRLWHASRKRPWLMLQTWLLCPLNAMA